jgi:hypothetical protein
MPISEMLLGALISQLAPKAIDKAGDILGTLGTSLKNHHQANVARREAKRAKIEAAKAPKPSFAERLIGLANQTQNQYQNQFGNLVGDPAQQQQMQQMSVNPLGQSAEQIGQSMQNFSNIGLNDLARADQINSIRGQDGNMFENDVDRIINTKSNIAEQKGNQAEQIYKDIIDSNTSVGEFIRKYLPADALKQFSPIINGAVALHTMRGMRNRR